MKYSLINYDPGGFEPLTANPDRLSTEPREVTASCDYKSRYKEKPVQSCLTHAKTGRLHCGRPEIACDAIFGLGVEDIEVNLLLLCRFLDPG